MDNATSGELIWGREWAADPDNAAGARRIAAMVEESASDGWEISDIIENMNQDANGAGTLLVRVIWGSYEEDSDADCPDRSQAREYWEGCTLNDADEIDQIMYDPAVLTEFVRGVVSVTDTLAAE